MFKFSMSRLMLSVSLISIVNISNAAYTITTNINPAKDLAINPNMDFGTVTPYSDLQPEITITNTGGSVLQLGGIATTDPVAAPFNIVQYPGCENLFVQPGDQCSFIVTFKPEAPGSYNDSFNIEIVSESASHVINLTGTGGAVAAEPDINITFSSIDFGTVDILQSTDQPYVFPPAGSPFPFVIIDNLGALDLVISDITVTGAAASEITIQGDCVGTVTPTTYCTFSIEFKPLTAGIKEAVISFASNDPDEGTFEMPIRATAAGEDDGVPAEVEDTGPNNGDGNNDAILDSRQSNVTTLVDAYDNYVTYIANAGYNFSNMVALQPTAVEAAPANLIIGSGIFDFTVEGVAPGGLIEVGVALPAGMNTDAYYMHAATADNPLPHWFDFAYDGETGAFILGDFTFTTSTGTKFTRNLISLALQDGGRGDADMTVNGVIKVTSAVSVRPNTSDDSGAIGLLQILCFVSVLIMARRFYQAR